MRLYEYLNERRQLKRMKREFTEAAESFMKDIAKIYSISSVYNVKVEQRKDDGGVDCFDKTIYLDTGRLSPSYLYHELAHWMQIEKWGMESYCQGMRWRRGYEKIDPERKEEIIKHHDRLERAIKRMAKDINYENTSYHDEFQRIVLL